MKKYIFALSLFLAWASGAWAADTTFYNHTDLSATVATTYTLLCDKNANTAGDTGKCTVASVLGILPALTISTTGPVCITDATAPGATGNCMNLTDAVPAIIITTTGLTQDHIYYRTSGSAWADADADGSGTYPARCYAISTTQCMISGTYTKSSHGFTVGANLYLSATAGAITNTAVGTGANLQVVGWALDANTIIFNVSPDYIVVP